MAALGLPVVNPTGLCQVISALSFIACGWASEARSFPRYLLNKLNGIQHSTHLLNTFNQTLFVSALDKTIPFLPPFPQDHVNFRLPFTQTPETHHRQPILEVAPLHPGRPPPTGQAQPSSPVPSGGEVHSPPALRALCELP